MEDRSEDDLRSLLGPVVVGDDGRKIILNFPSLEQAIQLLKPWRDNASRIRALTRLREALSTAGLNLEIRVNGRPMVELGPRLMRGALLTLLGLSSSTDREPLSAE